MRKYVDFVEGTDSRAVAGASVLVTTYPGNVTATLYADDAGTPLANPLTTDNTGEYSFYVANGHYTLQISGSGLVTKTITDVVIFDPSDVLASETAAANSATGAATSATAAAGSATAAAGSATAASGSASAAAGSASAAAGSASAASGSASTASTASATAGAYPNSAASNVPRGLTQASVGAITAGAGGTNGTFALAWSAGNFSINPTGTFTVSGGALTAVTITGPGLYIGSSPTVPTPSFAASTGLTGAAVALTAQFLVTAGQGYWVTSASGSRMDRYKNVGGVATADTSVGSVPLSLGTDNLVYGAVNGIRTSTDMLSGLTWNANTLMWNDGHTAAQAGFTCTNLLTVWPGELLKIVCGANHSTQNATVNCYDENQTFISNLLIGATPTSTDTNLQTDNPAYLTIPSGARYIRVGQNVSTTLLVLSITSSPEKYYTDNLQSSLKTSAQSNLLGNSRYYPTTAGALNTGNTSTTKGTGFVPVAVGDKITWGINTSGSTYGIALYDSSRTFLRFLEQNAATMSTERSYTLNAVDDASVAYMVGGHFSNTPSVWSAGYIYVSSKNSLDRKITEATGPQRGKGFRKSKLNWAALNANVTVSTVTGGATRVTVVTAPGFTVPTLPQPNVEGYAAGFRVVKVKLVATPGGTVSITWNNPQATTPAGDIPVKAYANASLVNVGDTAIMWCPSVPAGTTGNTIRCDVVGAQFDIVDSFAVEFSSSMGNEVRDFMWSILGNAPRVLEEQYSYTDMAIEALSADRLKTGWAGKKVAVFGNSLMFQMWTFGNYIEQYLDITITDCTTAGSTFAGNLTDANLAKIPTDATMAILSSGCAGIDPLANDITSRDRTKLEGAVNYAIDWIYTNRPNCRVVMCNGNYASNADYKPLADKIDALAVYRGIPSINTWQNSDINASNYAVTGAGDGVHLSDEGRKRKAAVIVGFLRSLSV